MAVRVPVVQRCLVCHGIQTVHLAAPDSACTTCHVSLVRTATLTREDVARFPAPPSHAAPDFLSPSGTPIHAPNAGRVAVARNLYFSGNTVVIDHGLGLFSLLAHMSAMDVREGDRVSAGQIVGRVGATGRVTDRHGVEAAASTTRCTGCHVRADCLDCHRPNAAARGAGYHPDGFIARHPASAYTREASCSDCHNVGAFCTSCHARAGLTASGGGVLRSGYHDARRFFVVGHGQAARQGLESCVSCHAERDCLTCHSAVGGRRFNPHGPGFDATRLRRKAFAMCTVCHGATVPTQ